GRRSGQPGPVRLRAVPRWHGLRARDRGGAHGARCARAVDRRRRFGGHAGGDRQALRRGAGRLTGSYLGITRKVPTATTAHSVPPARAHSLSASVTAALSLARSETMPTRPLRPAAIARQSSATR